MSVFPFVILLFTIIFTSISTKCQIRTGLFPTSGAAIFNTSYSSGNMELFYKMWIPPNINTNAINFDSTKNIPTLVLVHGSGPLNHDEQILIESSPDFYTFRDIAHGLCTEYNIIVFTYDKRSCTPYAPVPCFHNQPPLCTINNTITDWCFVPLNVTYFDFIADAIYAIKYIQNEYSFINPSNIVPVGHSQGASIVPWVVDYMQLTTAISLMGTGIPIDIVILYQQELLGVNQSIIDQEALTFKMIKNGSISGWTLVNILGSYVPAVFWKQWLDAGTNVSRLVHLKKLKHILTINSDEDWQVPPFTYEPLYDLINIVAANLSYELYASMNVFPNMIHQMIDMNDVIDVKYNVSNDIIYAIGSWVNGIFENTQSSSMENDGIVFSMEFNQATFVIFVLCIIVFVVICLMAVGYILLQKWKERQKHDMDNQETVPLVKTYQTVEN